MISASVRGWSVLTLDVLFCAAAAGIADASSPLTANCGSTLRSVTGSSAGPSGPSAKRSTMPNGDAANLASGGIWPVATLRGKLAALRKSRPEASLKPLGSSSVNWVAAGNGAVNWTFCTTESPSLVASLRFGLIGPAGDFRRIASACLRGTGALNSSDMGRIGRQPDCAFSRSQRNSALKGSRTL